MKKEDVIYYKMPVYLHGMETGYYIDTNFNVYNKKGKKQKMNIAATGYMTFAISYNGRKTRKSLHRAIAEAFIPNPDKKPVINHKDGNKLNNNLDNLEWCTFKENNDHAREIGLTPINVLPTGKGEKNPRSEHSEKLIREICVLLEKGYRIIDIHNMTGVSYNVIKQVKNKYTWTHVSKEYNF